METVTQKAAVKALIEAGESFHSRGWVPASSGNFSIRLSADRLAITASGRHKGTLTEADILTVDLQGKVIAGAARPSYETGLHTQLYRRDETIGAVLHTHSVASTVMSRWAGEYIDLQGYELLKIFEGIDSHEVQVRIPVYENDQNIDALATRVDAEMQRSGIGHAYLIRGHGIYTWAQDITIARYRVEALEFMLECELFSRETGRRGQ